MTSVLYWRIALPCPVRQLFTYSAASQLSVGAGDWVRVQFGRRELVGLVLESCNKPAVEYEIKPILEIQRADLRLTQSLVDFILWGIRYYHTVPWSLVSTFVPARILSGNPPKPESIWNLRENADLLISPSARRQSELIEWIRAAGPSTWQEISAAGFSRSLFRQVKRCGALQEAESCFRAAEIKRADLLHPHAEQKNAIAQVLQNKARIWLLEGVTGSGKTLVYLHLLKQALLRDEQVLVLVPEIGLIPQMALACQALVEQPRTFSSAMTDSERAEIWLACANGRAQLVIGTRSSLFLPFVKLGMIIVDEEHDSSYKQQEGIRYQARDLAVIRASQLGISAVLGSATPSLESLYNIESGRFSHLQLKKRVAGGAMPKWHLLEGRGTAEDAGLLPRSVALIGQHLGRGHQVLVFINRRGYSPCLCCSQCGWQARCENCDSRFTYHKSANELRCHQCDLRLPLPASCPICSSHKLHLLGQGTERIAQRLGSIFPSVPVVRVDRDATRGKLGIQKKLEEIQESGPAILVGTQMLAKGHHFPNLALAVILDLDFAMLSSDFRAAEQAVQLITQVAGRTGREGSEGEVVLQTEFPNHPILADLTNNNYSKFAGKQLRLRQQLCLPPFRYMAILRAESGDYRKALSLLQKSVRSVAEVGLRGCQIIGPSPSPMEKRAGRYRFQVQFLSETRSSLHELLSLVLAELDKGRSTDQLRWHLDIDPINLD